MRCEDALYTGVREPAWAAGFLGKMPRASYLFIKIAATEERGKMPGT